MTQAEPNRPTAGHRFRGVIWGFTEPFRTDKTPAWASILALLVAVAPGLAERYEHGRWGGYDPTIAVLTATLIALIWTAHYTFRAVRHARQAEERAETRRQLARMSIAAAVSAELEWLELSLDIVSGRIETKGVRFLERPQLRIALENLELFSSGTASKMSEFDAVLRQIESHALLYAADHEAAEEAALKHKIGQSGVPALSRDPAWVEDIRRIITSAKAMIPLLKRQLLSEF
jgi:hypothetical protein